MTLHIRAGSSSSVSPMPTGMTFARLLAQLDLPRHGRAWARGINHLDVPPETTSETRLLTLRVVVVGLRPFLEELRRDRARTAVDLTHVQVGPHRELDGIAIERLR